VGVQKAKSKKLQTAKTCKRQIAKDLNPEETASQPTY
jgi:hypothetical protein